MTSRPPARRLALPLALALSLGTFAAALLGPAQTLAQTQAHRAACSAAPARSTSGAHAKAKRTAHGCTQTSRKGKGRAQTHRVNGRRVKLNTKRTSRTDSTPAASAAAPARCEDGATPVRAADGTFSCVDGSEPECEGGATPTASHGGSLLLCPVAAEVEAGANEECEAEGSGCAVSDEQSCETPGGGEDSEFACEG